MRYPIITPDDLAGARAPSAPERPLPLDGPVQAIGHGSQVRGRRSRREPAQRASSDHQLIQNGHAPQGESNADPPAE